MLIATAMDMLRWVHDEIGQFVDGATIVANHKTVSLYVLGWSKGQADLIDGPIASDQFFV